MAIIGLSEIIFVKHPGMGQCQYVAKDHLLRSPGAGAAPRPHGAGEDNGLQGEAPRPPRSHTMSGRGWGAHLLLRKLALLAWQRGGPGSPSLGQGVLSPPQKQPWYRNTAVEET